MFCKNCGASIADQATTCPNCGASTQSAPAPVMQPSAQQANNLQAVLNVGNDVSKLLNYVALVCYVLAGFLWIYAGVSKNSQSATFSDYYLGLGLAFLPTLISQGFLASAVVTFVGMRKANTAKKRIAYLASMIIGIVTVVLTICSMYALLEASSVVEMGDMNFAAWMVLIFGIIGVVCSITNYVQSKKQ